MPTPIEQLLSRTVYATDGTTVNWDFSFSGGYIDRGHVKAYVDLPTGERTELTVTPGMFIGPYQLFLSPALAAGSTLTIYRDTPKDLPLVDFADEGGLSEIALDTMAKQAIFVAAETTDTVNTSSSYDAEQAANQAATSAAAAVISANAAGASAVTAGGHATSAGLSAVAAAASAASITVEGMTTAAADKATPADADHIPLVDSAAANLLKKLSWANIKATLKTYFDGFYAGLGANTNITSLSAITSVNGGQLAGLRNRIINGNFGINQRAVSGTVTLAAGVYGHDRWKAGAGGCTYTFATVANVTTITITAGTLMQVIEGINLESGAFTLSWTGSATGRVDSGAYGASGIAGTAVGGTNQKVEFSTGTLSKVQYEFGSTISKFETRLSSIELMLCYAYYLRLVIATAGTFQSAGETGGCFVATKVTMRATPTVLDIGGGTLANVTTAAADTPSPQGCRFVVTGTASGAWNALGRTIQFTAEL